MWDACTNPERLRRWFAPVTGDLRLGGSYQIEGNAGGRILRCEPPRLLAVSWIYGADDPETAPLSEVEVRLTAEDGGSTVFELEHTAIVDSEMWGTYGPGATGVGYDLALLGLALHLRGEHIDDPAAWQETDEARDYMTRSSNAWGAAHRNSGAAPDEVSAAVENTTRFYVPERDGAGPG